MNTKQNNQKKDIDLLRQMVIEKLGWGPVKSWHSSMFKELSEEIFKSSQVLLSVTTLKRFFGVVKHEGKPSTNTLDALSIYSGHDNWRAFKTAIPPSNRERAKIKIPGKFYFFLAPLFLIVLFVISWNNHKPNNYHDVEDFIFTSRPITNSFPNSVVFDFDLEGIESDNIIIQQYWDRNKTISIGNHQHTATGIYYFPGYFRAKFIVDNVIIKEHDLFLKSEGWMGMLEYDPIPKYFTVNQENNMLSSPPEIFEEIKNSEKPLVSSFHYINDFGPISGDNFKMKFATKYIYDDKWATCHSTKIYVLGTTGAMIIPFSKPGCSSNNNLMLNDLYLNGKENDLSAFGVRLDTFKDIEIVCKNKDVLVRVDGIEIYRGRYKESMGRFVGVRFKFEGLGVVKNFSLLDNDGNIINELTHMLGKASDFD